MSTTIRTLSPAPLWNNFADLNAVPRASKKEKRVIEFAKSFGEKLGLPTHVDEIGNVIIKKPASPGMENRMTVALQGHLDMVHQKNSSTNFNFDSQGIEMLVEGDWVKANGTTLAVSYTHLRAHETVLDLVCRLLLETNTPPPPPALSSIIPSIYLSHIINM